MKTETIDIGGVNILDPKHLIHFAQDTTRAGRVKLAHAVSEIFVEKELSAQEQRLASEILINLVRQAEVDLREALAEQLAVVDTAPQELMVFLANDQISVAESVLMHSTVLNDVDLMYVIASKGNAYWQAIAKRDNLSPMVADRLIDTEDTSTVLNLIDNQRAVLQKGSMKKLVKAALRSEELHAPLLRRPEVDTEVATDLYLVVSEALRREISDKFKPMEHVVTQALEALVHELTSEARGIREYTPQMIMLAKRYQERGEINPDLMIRTLRRGQIGFFVTLMSERVKLAPEYVLRLIQKEGGRHFVVACRYLGMQKADFASVFLLSRGLRTGDKIVDQRELAMALKYFDTISDYDVERIMRTWVKNPEMI